MSWYNHSHNMCEDEINFPKGEIFIPNIYFNFNLTINSDAKIYIVSLTVILIVALSIGSIFLIYKKFLSRIACKKKKTATIGKRQFALVAGLARKTKDKTSSK